MNIFATIIYAVVLMMSVIIVWHNLLKIKINFKSYKLYISLVGMVLISIINYFMTYKFIKITLITIVLTIFFKYLFSEDWIKTMITPLFSQMIIMISECIFILILVSIFNLDVVMLKIQYLGTFIVNIGIALISLIIIKIPFISKCYNVILSTVERINKKFFIILLLLIIGIANVLAMTTYYEVDVRLLILLNVIFTLFCFLVVLYSFKMQSNYNKVSDKYNVAINSLTEYENMMTKYRINNHENKNLLLTVRAMIINKEKDIPQYIDSIVKGKYEDNENLLFKMSVIPSGGLRATIYSEILKIKDNRINYSLNIDKNLKTMDLIELDTNTIIDICKIIGVLIDNSIDAVKTLKQKNIGIDLYLDSEQLNIKISNNYAGKIEVDKVFNEGYTTKGKNHGYGLSLVKKIVDSNNFFEIQTEVSKKIFSQTLRIKYKKITF